MRAVVRQHGARVAAFQRRMRAGAGRPRRAHPGRGEQQGSKPQLHWGFDNFFLKKPIELHWGFDIFSRRPPVPGLNIGNIIRKPNKCLMCPKTEKTHPPLHQPIRPSIQTTPSSTHQPINRSAHPPTIYPPSDPTVDPCMLDPSSIHPQLQLQRSINPCLQGSMNPSSMDP